MPHPTFDPPSIPPYDQGGRPPPSPPRDDRRRPLEVLVVDDSAVVRQALLGLLGQLPDLNVTTAADPLIAMAKMERRRPDVIILDLEMPRMDGLSFLRRIMTRDPIPVVVCSSYAERGTRNALRALEEGAVEVLAKPRLGVREFFHETLAELGDVVRAAARARPRLNRVGFVAPPPPRWTAEAVVAPGGPVTGPLGGDRIVGLGASTGGPEALRRILPALPADAPGMVVVQHMPPGFLTRFAEHLDGISRIKVREAADGDPVVPGQALIAPGDLHTTVVGQRGEARVRVTPGPLVCRHRPSVDVLFRSLARSARAHAVGVIMTGMGEDGAAGLVEMKAAGAATIAQDEASSVIFGMPREAIARGGVDAVVPLEGLAEAILATARRLYG